MKRAIREHWKDFASIVGLLVVTVFVAGYILLNERLSIPFISPAQYTLTFTKAGTYGYDCLVHPGMDGTITVMPAGM